MTKRACRGLEAEPDTLLLTHTMRKLPIELESQIIHYFAEDKPALRGLSLVCGAWRRIAQGLLFHSLQIFERAHLAHGVKSSHGMCARFLADAFIRKASKSPTSQLFFLDSVSVFDHWQNLDAFRVAIPHMSSLRELRLSSMGIDDVSWWPIFSKVESLRLNRSSIANASVAENLVALFPNLRKLELDIVHFLDRTVCATPHGLFQHHCVAVIGALCSTVLESWILPCSSEFACITFEYNTRFEISSVLDPVQACASPTKLRILAPRHSCEYFICSRQRESLLSVFPQCTPARISPCLASRHCLRIPIRSK